MIIVTPDNLPTIEGRQLGSSFVKVTASLIADYVEMIGDKNALHQSGDNQEALCPGNLLLALTPGLVQQLIEWRGFKALISAQYKQVRYLKPVYAGDNVQLDVIYTQIRRVGSDWHARSILTLCSKIQNAPIMQAEHHEVWQG